MSPRIYRTAEIAEIVGCHPNTVRKYEEWGLLPAVPRTPTGYRLYSERHLDCMRLSWTALHSAWPGTRLRKTAAEIVQAAVGGDLDAALLAAYHYQELVAGELVQAEAAAAALQQWADQRTTNTQQPGLSIQATARLLDLTPDMLRNYEKNGLLTVPRNPKNGYRQYGLAEIERLRVIRLLLRSGFSLLAILRALTRLDQERLGNARELLAAAIPDEDVYTAADRWLATLEDHAQRAQRMIDILREMRRKEAEAGLEA